MLWPPGDNKKANSSHNCQHNSLPVPEYFPIVKNPNNNRLLLKNPALNNRQQGHSKYSGKAKHCSGRNYYGWRQKGYARLSGHSLNPFVNDHSSTAVPVRPPRETTSCWRYREKKRSNPPVLHGQFLFPSIHHAGFPCGKVDKPYNNYPARLDPPWF